MGGTNPAYFSSCGMNCPVEWVSWNEAQAFIDALNAKEGRTNCHTTHNTCYSLPTESQWEYAARARTTSAFYSGALTNISCSPTDPNMAKIGWYCGNANNTTHPVAQKNPNHWGLYDMAGNVWEWCQDMYGTYPVGPVTDPSGATYGSAPVFRGGSWESEARWTRSANRGHGSTPHCHWNFVGFRLVLPSGQ
jgi:formylglycine-generating enzyme required for sulfatase activity